MKCTNCKKPLAQSAINTDEFVPCAHCGSKQTSYLFPAAAVSNEPVNQQENILMDDDSSCFYHPTKKAIIPCASCGRFLCPLCDIDMDGDHICFPCMESGKNKKRYAHLESQSVVYDGIALRLTLISILFWPFSLIMAPAALYLSVRHWNSPSSILPRSKWRFVVAFLLGLSLVGCWIAAFYFIVIR